MLNVKFLPNVQTGFYTVDCSEVASPFYSAQVQALIAYLRKLGYRSTKLTVVVGVITLGERKQAHDVARFVRALSFTQASADFQGASALYAGHQEFLAAVARREADSF